MLLRLEPSRYNTKNLKGDDMACGRRIAKPVAVGLLGLSPSDCCACGSRIAGPVAVDCWACGSRIAGHVVVEGNVGGTKIV